MDHAEFKVRVRLLPPGDGYAEPGTVPSESDLLHPEEWEWEDLLKRLASGDVEEPLIIDSWIEP